jgi:hypothetical protein
MAHRRSGRLPLAVAATALSIGAPALAAPAMASAAATIGANLANSPQQQNTCAGDTPDPAKASCGLAVLTEGGLNQAARSDGVITRWRVAGGSGPLVFRVLRPQAGGAYLFVSSSAVESPANTGVVTFDTRQPIAAGDYIGVEVESATARIGIDLGQPATETAAAVFGGPIADGASVVPANLAPGGRGYLNADVEPDADHDGYGDETQDQCPTNAATQGACPPPPVVVDKLPPTVKWFGRTAHLSHAGRVSFFIRSNEQASGTASATLGLPKTSKVVRFRRRTLHLKAGAKTKVTLRLSRKNAAAVRKALRKHRHVTAKITVRLKDSTGNLTTKRLRLRIR